MVTGIQHFVYTNGYFDNYENNLFMTLFVEFSYFCDSWTSGDNKNRMETILTFFDVSVEIFFFHRVYFYKEGICY